VLKQLNGIIRCPVAGSQGAPNQVPLAVNQIGAWNRSDGIHRPNLAFIIQKDGEIQFKSFFKALHLLPGFLKINRQYDEIILFDLKKQFFPDDLPGLPGCHLDLEE